MLHVLTVGLVIKESKCSFGLKEIKLLCSVTCADGRTACKGVYSSFGLTEVKLLSCVTCADGRTGSKGV